MAHDPRSILSGTNNKLAFDRLLFFSDAVFAIAITLLALELRLPAGVEGGAEGARLWLALAAMWPKYLSFLISFLVIGLYWQGHHRMFRLINRFDDRLLWLNLFFLMCIIVVPFPTSVLGEHANEPVAAAFYACVLALTGLLQLAMWLYATAGRRLVEVSLDDMQYTYLRRSVAVRMVIAPLVFLLSTAAARASPIWAELSWILIAPALAVADRIGRHAREKESK
ncbi:MAG: TMEM175 family protein [Burkholderiales bacterium]